MSDKPGPERSDRLDQEHGKPDTSGFGGFVRSFAYAFSGIKQAFSGERNIKVDVGFAIFAIIMCVVLRCTYIEWIIVILLIGLVIAAEMINTSIEAVVDLASPQYNPLAKRAKDVAAAAVLVLAITSAIVGIIIFVTAFLRLI